MDAPQSRNTPPKSHRRKRTKWDNFKECYLPFIIASVTLIFVIVTIIGASVNNAKRKELLARNNQAQAIAAQEKNNILIQEAARLLDKANEYAKNYYLDDAIATLESFSGDITKFPQLYSALQNFYYEKASWKTWDDPKQVLNLSFHVLIADPLRAFANSKYGSSYNRNFITTDEFRLILEQLYQNGYVLVSIDDIVSESSDDNSSRYTPKTLYLPVGKKPLIITQTHVNYYTYMTDGDDSDIFPDQNGAGFACKLIVDNNGNLTNEMIDKNGNKITGEFDLIPILNSFIALHPDFSYQGARAIIAVTGYEGVFGYRTNPDAKNILGDDYQQEIDNAKRIAKALRDSGFEIACYTYGNQAYGEIGIDTLKNDLNSWNTEIVPIIGQTDILVFAQESDIARNTPYSGEKYNALLDAGFRYYFGFCNNGQLWSTIENSCFRQARILVTGSNLKYNSLWFNGILSPVEILSSLRGTIPK